MYGIKPRHASPSGSFFRLLRLATLPCLLALALLVVACGGSKGSGSSSDEPTPVIGVWDDPQDFRSFVVRLEDALESGNVQFFLSNTRFEKIACFGGAFPDPPSSCVGVPQDHKVPSILIGVLESEGSYLDAVQFEDFMLEFMENVDADASDDFGGAEPQVYAIGILRPRYQVAADMESVQAIVTRIAGPQPETPLVPGPEGERGVLVFSASHDGRRWGITGVTVMPSEYLDASGPEAAKVKGLFQFWQRWDGAVREGDGDAGS